LAIFENMSSERYKTNGSKAIRQIHFSTDVILLLPPSEEVASGSFASFPQEEEMREGCEAGLYRGACPVVAGGVVPVLTGVRVVSRAKVNSMTSTKTKKTPTPMRPQDALGSGA
jgi:hypothetical protein